MQFKSIYEKLTYVSEVAEGVKIRIFGLFGAPKGATHVPGILHIHGGGQTASLAWVQYWAKRGYACVTYDFCGKWEHRTEYTDWGPLAKNCNMASNGVYQVHPTPRMSGWFHWALAGRRALTLLAQSPAVEPDRLGIFGISVGGTLCWLVAGVDARVKAAIPIYGCGYNVDRRKAVYGLVPSEDQLIYQEALAGAPGRHVGIRLQGRLRHQRADAQLVCGGVDAGWNQLQREGGTAGSCRWLEDGPCSTV
jgi:dienelactone hydrolase